MGGKVGRRVIPLAAAVRRLRRRSGRLAAAAAARPGSLALGAAPHALTRRRYPRRRRAGAKAASSSALWPKPSRLSFGPGHPSGLPVSRCRFRAFWAGVEPATRRVQSTALPTELPWRRRPDSNRRPSGCRPDALPLSYVPRLRAMEHGTAGPTAPAGSREPERNGEKRRGPRGKRRACRGPRSPADP
jgi:hypothetical protein